VPADVDPFAGLVTSAPAASATAEYERRQLRSAVRLRQTLTPSLLLVGITFPAAAIAWFVGRTSGSGMVVMNLPVWLILLLAMAGVASAGVGVWFVASGSTLRARLAELDRNAPAA
jgi:hypothetical protein